MTCKHCGREIARVAALGGFGESVVVHVDTHMTICDREAWYAGASYFELSHAEP